MKKNKFIPGLYYQEEETIIAQCTPVGSGAIALIRLSGKDAISIVEKIGMLASGEKISDVPTHTIHLGWVTKKNGEKIDQVMFSFMHSPKSFTGENVIEITTHNNQFVVSEIIETAIHSGARLAQQGEFSKRAFLNNKIDLHQAEAINELIHAQTQAALKSSLSQLEGSLSKKIKMIEDDLLKALALSEASFEFVEDEEAHFDNKILLILKNKIKEIENLKKTFNHQKQIKEGIRIALIGAVNAGKSSLFNSLVSQKRAIVTNIPGTTRDVIEAFIYKYGTHQTIVDTAGIRETKNVIEKAGIKKSMEEAKKADIILLIQDCSQKITISEKKIYQEILKKFSQKIIVAKNKSDLNQHYSQKLFSQKSILISCKTKKNIKALEKKIKKKIHELFSEIESPFLLNQRQYNHLIKLEVQIKHVISMFKKNIQHEIVSLHLKDALAQISELSGKTISKKATDEIFKNFCIGK